MTLFFDILTVVGIALLVIEVWRLERQRSEARHRAGRAESVIDDVRTTCDAIDRERTRLGGEDESFGDGCADAVTRIRIALDDPPKHVGNRANAEDCPACSGTNLPYPWICPGGADGPDPKGTA
ncbi:MULTISPECIES: hypothetical protein [unclassified Streptomyces]|uniref:hypothetical protein n=1 Tax=unclassified Streptomyces TaxID=2593676 RepID=UPI0035D58646